MFARAGAILILVSLLVSCEPHPTAEQEIGGQVSGVLEPGDLPTKRIPWSAEPTEGAMIVKASTSDELALELARMKPGMTIVLEDGIYSGKTAFNINARATLEQPITIRAANQGGAVLTNSARFAIAQSSQA